MVQARAKGANLAKDLEVTNIQRIFAEDCAALGNQKASFHCARWHNLCITNKNIKRMKQVEERYISLLTDFGFDRLFEEAEIAKFTPQEMREYETSKMAYRDIKNSVDTAKREGIEIGMEKGMKQGREEGRAEGMNLRSLEIARKMLAKGMDEASIMDMTGLTAEEIKLLKAEM